MSRAHPGDEHNTIRQIRDLSSGIEERKTWLRHKSIGESGLIDLMVLEGTYTLETMIDELIKNPQLTKKSRTQWKIRINDHLTHLSTIDGDSKNRASGMGGHNLKIKISESEKISFDY